MSSSYGIHVPSPDEINYQEAHQQQRVERARKLIDPGDVIAVVESRLAAEADPKVHPLYNLVCWVLDQHVAPLDGGQVFDRWHQLVLAAVDTCLDELLAMED
jgi:hypothetical protein